MEKGIHLKGLNGIRFFAALSVLLSHTVAAYEQLGFKRIVAGWDIADYGVTMFFTLSGFLITYLLHKEKVRFGTINIPKFYIRRILRIWPLYYFFIILVLIIGYNVKFPAGLSYYVFLLANIPFVTASWLPLLSHYWSLAVEEQFYIFWPWLLKWLPPLKSITVFLFFFLILKGVLRICIPETAAYQFLVITRFDCMAIGGLAAILLDSNSRYFNSICFGWPAQLLSWGIVLLAATGYFKLPGFIRHDIFAVACAVIIVNAAFNKKPMIGLNNKLLDLLGRISYGIYIYHVLMIYLLGLLIKGRAFFDVFSQFTLVILAMVISTILVAWLSFEFLEKPFLKLKDRFAKITSRS